MILQVRSVILDILLDIRYFCCKKGQKKSKFWGNIVLCQIDLFCENSNLFFCEFKQSPTYAYNFLAPLNEFKIMKIFFMIYSVERGSRWLNSGSGKT